ncbi:MAG: lipid-A-disaccharide synthase [Methylococcus sp.]|nr:lipid-A-disaccharide synthase [Methylococcus sp.]
MAERAPLVMLVAGEASGNQHAAAMFLELRSLIPEIRGIGMGGSAMREAGIDIRVDSTGLGVIGLTEIARHYGEIQRALESMKALARTERPDLLICVDYKEFNFRLARAAKAAGIKVLFYVSPQVWAWRPGRVKDYGRAIDHMAVIFPFEVPFYERHGIPVTYVGHPLAGKIAPVADAENMRRELGLDESGPLVALLPGSRGNEIHRLLPLMLQTAERIAGERPDVRFVLIQAQSVSDVLLDGYLKASALPLRVVKERRHDVLGCCDAVMTTSGTATLEVALLGVPMAIVYKLAPFSYWLGKLLVTIPFIGLPNILAGRKIVQEFIQHEANAEAVGAELLRILSEPDYALQMRRDLAEIQRALGEGGGSRRLAELATELLGSAARTS